MGANRHSRSSSRSSPPGHLRPGSVPRTALVDRLCGSSAPVVTVIAPAGYGKTTVLRQWAEQDDRPFAWFSIDDDDNDPAVLVTYLAVALDRIQPVDARVFAALRGNAGIRSVVVPRLGAALFAASPFVLVIDNVHLLHQQESLDTLASLSDHLPVGAQVVLAGRSVRGFPLARLRAHGQLEELGAEALALDERGDRVPARGGRRASLARTRWPTSDRQPRAGPQASTSPRSRSRRAMVTSEPGERSAATTGSCATTSRSSCSPSSRRPRSVS